MNRLPILAALAALALAAPSFAQMDHGAMDHGSMDHGDHAEPAADDTPATTAFRAANDRMHAGMNIPFSGDANVDFARGMIPHHQGAIDMASTLLTYGSDPELQALAEEIIANQQAEIAFLEGWLAMNAD